MCGPYETSNAPVGLSVTYKNHWTKLVDVDDDEALVPSMVGEKGLQILVSGGWGSASSQSAWLDSVHGELITRKIDWRWDSEFSLEGALLVEDEDPLAVGASFGEAERFVCLIERKAIGKHTAQLHVAIHGEARALRHEQWVEGPRADHGQLAVDDVGRHLEGCRAVRADVAGFAPWPAARAQLTRASG